MSTDPTRTLASFLAGVRYEALPAGVVTRCEELFLDWFASCLAGKGSRPVEALSAFSRRMGPDHGTSLVLPNRTWTTPYFAALVNAASSHVVEQDDLHNGSVLHPATVVFPAALAVAQSLGVDGRAFIAASVVGYEAGIRVGEYLGRSHYKVFHTTGTAGTLAAAAGVAHLLKLDADRFLHALGAAGTQAAGLWEFLRDAADSKQLHTAKAAADGLLAADLAAEGMTGASRILEGAQGMAKGMLGEGDESKLTGDLGTRWALTETSFKFHASCRHTHPAADALLELVTEHDIDAGRIRSIKAYVYRAAMDVLGPVTDPRTVHQSKFSMGFVLALIAARRSASVNDFSDDALTDPRLRDLHDKVEMVFDERIDALYPHTWSARVELETSDGDRVVSQIDEPKGDPGNPLSRAEIEDKARRLGAYRGGAVPGEMGTVIEACWRLHELPNVNALADALLGDRFVDRSIPASLNGASGIR